MRTQAAQPKSNDSRHRWASRRDNVPAPQSRHNRPPKSNAPPSAAKKAARVRVLTGFTPPQPHTGGPDGMAGGSFQGPQTFVRGAPGPPRTFAGCHLQWRSEGAGEHKFVQNSSAGTFFEWDMYFKHFQSKMELPSVCVLCADAISSTQRC